MMNEIGNNNIGSSCSNNRRRVGGGGTTTCNSFRCTPVMAIDENAPTPVTILPKRRRRSMDLQHMQHTNTNTTAAKRYSSNRYGGGGGGGSSAAVAVNRSRFLQQQSQPSPPLPHQPNLVHEILIKQDLSRAGVLFSLSSSLILDDFPMTVEILKSIVDSKAYASNLNQQSIVEIVLTKCISALRETKMISSYYDDLLDLIEICLKYDLNNSICTTTTTTTSATSDIADIDDEEGNSDDYMTSCRSSGIGCRSSIRYVDVDAADGSAADNNVESMNHHRSSSNHNNGCYSHQPTSSSNSSALPRRRGVVRFSGSGSSTTTGAPSIPPAHANIVSDILSCILLDYLDEELSAKAIPVCIKIMHHANAKRELIREIVSYLNLIACRSPDLLVDYVYYLASALLKGYAGLGALLYQIAESSHHIECIFPLVKHFVRAFKLIADSSPSDFAHVLQIIYLVSLSHVQLVIVYLDEILAYMPDSNYQDLVLDIIYSVATQSPIALEAYLKLFDARIYYDSFKVEKIISTVGKSIKKHSDYCTELLVNRIKYLMGKYKRDMAAWETSSSCRVGSAGVAAAATTTKRRHSLVVNHHHHHNHHNNNHHHHHHRLEPAENENENNDENSVVDLAVISEAATSHNASTIDQTTTSESQSPQRSSNNQTSGVYRNGSGAPAVKIRTSTSFHYAERRSSVLIVNSRILTRRLVQLLTEIYEVAQVFPYVLTPHLTEMEHLLRKHAFLYTVQQQSAVANNAAAASEANNESIAYLIERLKELQRENSPREDMLDEILEDLSTTNEEASLSGGGGDNDDNVSEKEDIESKLEEGHHDRNHNQHDAIKASSTTTSNSHQLSSNLNSDSNSQARVVSTESSSSSKTRNSNTQTSPDKLAKETDISNGDDDASGSGCQVKTAAVASNPRRTKKEIYSDDDEPELVALTNNLEIKEPKLALPDDDDDEDEDMVGVLKECITDPTTNRLSIGMMNGSSGIVSPSRFADDLNRRRIEEPKQPVSSTMRVPPPPPQSCQVQTETTSTLATIPMSPPLPPSIYERDDVVERFCTKHIEKIRNYIRDLSRVLPIPDFLLQQHEGAVVSPSEMLNKSAYANTSFCKKLKTRKSSYSLKFYCSKKLQNCCLFDKTYFEIRTAYPALWIHIIFLALQAKSNRVLNQMDKEIVELKLVYEKLNEKLPFVALVTSSFPQEKQTNELMKELKESRIFDLFEHVNCGNGGEEGWACYLCSNPDRMLDLNEDNPARPLIQGQLKEKHGKWKFLRRWHKRVFTLTGGNIVYFKKDMRQESLNVRYIRSIQPIASSKSDKNVPKVFEICTNTNSFLLKAQTSKDAAQWLQFLQLTKALQNSRIAANNENNLNTSSIHNQAFNTTTHNNTTTVNE